MNSTKTIHMKKIYIVILALIMLHQLNAQNIDSTDFIFEFEKFKNEHPISFEQQLKYDSISAVIDSNKAEIEKKNRELITIINKINEKKIDSLRADTSGLVTFSEKENKFYIYSDNQVKLSDLQDLTEMNMKRNFRKFFKQAKKNKIGVYSESGYSSHLRSSQNMVAMFHQPQTSNGGTSLPPLYTSGGNNYLSLAELYMEYIIRLLDLYTCNPNILSYYMTLESPDESWQSKAHKRRKFIDYIRNMCPLKE